MKINDIFTGQQRIISQATAATCLTLRSLKGTDKDSEAAAAIEYANHPVPLQTTMEWHYQVGPGGLKQVEGIEVIKAYT